MGKYQLGEIDMLIADPNRQLRTSLKGVLHAQGFRGIMDAANVEQLEDGIRQANPDLIICDVGLEGGDVCSLIRKLRHNEFGQNPFCGVILIIDEPNEAVVRAAVDAGVDDLQVKPVVAQSIINRVHYLIEKRKPFVVTTDYIGPDRRKNGVRAGAMEIPLVNVPNSMAGKATGKYDPRELHRMIQNAIWDVNAQKIERHAFQVSYLVERIVPAYLQGQIDKEHMGYVNRLVLVAADIMRRLDDSDYVHISDLASTLGTVAQSLWRSGTMPKKKDLELLPELAAALSATFNNKSAAASVASEISKSVKDRYAGQR